MAAPVESPPLLRMRGMAKAYPGVQALRGVDLELRAGEVLALLGENGAGKSTLIKILGGAHAPDAGVMEIEGRPVQLESPTAARRAGIAVIYQELHLVPGLSARENIFLGQEISRGGFIVRHEEHARAAALLAQMGAPLDPETPCAELSVAQQQVVEIAKALVGQARILVLDEPTAALSPREVTGLLARLRELRAQGLGILYISHRLDEVFQIADRAMVLRDGAHVATEPMANLTRQRVIELMVGRSLDQEFPKRRTEIGAERLVVRGLRRGQKVRDVSFAVRRGEVLGLAGLVGAGRTETARLIFGADAAEAGAIVLDGRELRLRGPRDAIAAGICLLTEDRKSQGLVLGQSVQENFALPNLAKLSRAGWMDKRREAAAFDQHVEKLQIRLRDRHQSAGTLSGGNQQKVVLAKWLERHAEVVIFDEPTRGIDVGARHEIYHLINQLAAQGKAVLLISSDLPEVLGMSDRVLVMREGRVTGEIADAAGATQEQVMVLATADAIAA